MRREPNIVLRALSVVPMGVIVFLLMAALWANVGVRPVPAEPPAAGEPMQMPKWWQDMQERSREAVARKCEMGALQSSNAARYFELCMQQEGYR